MLPTPSQLSEHGHREFTLAAVAAICTPVGHKPLTAQTVRGWINRGVAPKNGRPRKGYEGMIQDRICLAAVTRPGGRVVIESDLAWFLREIERSRSEPREQSRDMVHRHGRRAQAQVG